MVKLLQELRCEVTIVLVEHDMQAVFALADRISVLVYGRVIASGDSAAIKADAAVRDAYLGEQDVLQQEAADG
jgi:branched-chain amino acid transport system ATP-binding protein